FDGDEGHSMCRIVVNKLIEQRGAHFAHHREEAQPQVVARHLTQKIRIERGVLDLERPDQNTRSIKQCDMALVESVRLRPRQCDISAGTVIDSRMLRVTPPRMKSRR